MSRLSKRVITQTNRSMQKKFLIWASLVFFLKLAIIFRIEGINAGSGDRVYFVDGAWLGADGENYLKGFFALLNDGIFSPENILNYWPAGYPIFIWLLSFIGKSYVLTMLSILQSAVFSFAVFFFASQFARTRNKKLSWMVFAVILLNPTLSLSSISVGYESLTASGLLMVIGVIIKDFIEKDNQKFLSLVIINSVIFGFIVFLQPRLVITAIVILFIWILSRKGIKGIAYFLSIGILITLFFPATLVYRNNKAMGLNSISTNLGVTMAIGSGPGATGGYQKRTQDVPCETSGNVVEKDQQLTKCILLWYVKNPQESIRLFYNKTIYFWSPWTGPLANGTMARNPWVTFSPVISIASSSKDGYELVTGAVGKLISWAWMIGGLFLLIYGFMFLWRQNSLERFIALLGASAICANWLVSLITIGDHRFRVPIMGLSLFFQAIGLKTLFLFGRSTKSL